MGIACACFVVLAAPGAATAGKGKDRDRGGNKSEQRGANKANKAGKSNAKSSSGGRSQGGQAKRGAVNVRRQVANAQRRSGSKSGSDSGSVMRSLASGNTGENQRSARSSRDSGNGNRKGNSNNKGDGNSSAPSVALPRSAPPMSSTPPPSPIAAGAGRFGSSSGLGSSAPAGPFSGVAPVAPIAPLTADRAAAPRAAAPVVRTRLAAAERLPIVRTVRQVVEVVPPVAWALIALLAMLTLMGAGASWLLAARKRHAERQHEALLSDVGALQRALLPPSPEQIAGVATSVAYRPVSGPMAGGDFYDVFAIDDERLGVIIGDVSRSGIEGIGLTATIRHTVRAYLEAGMSPRSALQVAAQVLEPQLGHTRATVSVGLYDRPAGVLTYAAAGHAPPVILGATGFEPVAAAPSPPLGAGEDTGLRQTSVALPPGSLVCFYTDGVVEARVSGALYGYRRLSLSLTDLGPHAGAPALLDRVADEADALPDDMAAVVLHVAQHVRSAQDTEGVRRVEELELSRDDLNGDLPAEFMAACGVPSRRIEGLVSDFRATAQRIGGAVLRVRMGPGVPRAELALSRVDVLSPVAARHGDDNE